MFWIVVPGAVIVAMILVALIGIQPKGSRPVGNTHLMTAARICLGLLVAILVLIAVGVIK